MKDLLKKIICIIFIILFISITPISNYFSVNNNVYASVGTFEQMIDSDLFTQVLIATGIAAGLVFINVESEWAFTEEMKEYFKTLGGKHTPEGPQGPDLKQLIKASLIGTVIFNAGIQGLKILAKIDAALWSLIKDWVDDNYDEGENYEDIEIIEYTGKFGMYNYKFDFSVKYNTQLYANCILNGQFSDSLIYLTYGNNHILGYKNFEVVNIVNTEPVLKRAEISYKIDVNTINDGWISLNQNHTFMYGDDLTEYPIVDPTSIAYGTPGVVDNPNYDWNNNKTGTKVIPIPIKVDPYGDPIKIEVGEDEDKLEVYAPGIDIEHWIGVTPEEIPLLDPSGLPYPDIPTLPDIDEDMDQQTGIIIKIGNMVQTIVGQLTKLMQAVQQVVANTNQMIFGTPAPVFDPVTGIQIDPETGMPVELEPEVATGSGNIGDGIDTDIPTDFDWGDFKYFFDIFFIFIYFIIILILILLKFLSIVFTSLPGIPANTDLFAQYPTILEGVNYVKNLKVGGLSITVHQAFEYVFYIFFYIFVIKQIRKLYNAHVFEQPAENQKNTKDMKMDYYEKGNNKYKDEDYENIKFTGWGD